jgi:hypothetical protein
LQDQEALAGLAEQRGGRHPHVVIVDQRMARLVRVGADQMVGGLDLEARGVGRDQERRSAVMHRHVRIGDRDDDEERGDGCVAGEVLSPGDHPVVAVADGPGGEDARVGSALRLGHREAGEDFTGQQPRQVAFLLVFGAEAGDDLRVAGIGCLGSEHDRRPRAAAQDLVDQRQLDRAEALPAEFRTEVRRPQPLVADLLFERVDDFAALVVQRQELTAGEQHLQRLDLFADELADPVELFRELGFGREVPCHIDYSSVLVGGDPRRPAAPRLRSPGFRGFHRRPAQSSRW